MKQRTINQNKALHLGCTQIADTLVENNISINVAFKNLEVRPTMENIKSIYRQIAKAKYDIESTTELTSKQVDEVWEELTKALSETTHIYFQFPSEESRLEYLQSYEENTITKS